MENADNVYGEFAGMVRGLGSMDNPETLFIGEIKTCTASKFEVEVDGLILDEDDVYIADYLKYGYEFPLSTSYVSEVHFGSETTTKQSKAVRGNRLKKGDLVALMQCSDNDTWIVLCKVVKP